MGSIDITAARCEALFASPQQPGEEASCETVRDAIRRTARAFGIRGCAARVAQEFGDHPETAVARMRWARRMVAETFPVRSGADSASPPRGDPVVPMQQAA
jgi:hypothetical protein